MEQIQAIGAGQINNTVELSKIKIPMYLWNQLTFSKSSCLSSRVQNELTSFWRETAYSQFKYHAQVV